MKTRKRYLFCSLAGLFLAMGATGQQTSQYTQYLFNHLQINPAVAGSKECVDMKLGIRRQWVGFEDAPRNAFANFHLRLKGKRPNPVGNYHGIGGVVETDNTGPIKRSTLYGIYAYHLRLNNRAMLGMGVNAGFQQYSLDRNKIRLGNYSDPLATGDASNRMIPVVGVGVWYYSENAYAGLSLRQLTRNKITTFSENSRLSHHWALTAGRKFSNSNGISYVPSALLKFAPLSSPAFDINLLVDFRNTLTLGIGYRSVDAFVAMFRVNFLRYLSVSYSFDYTTSQLRLDSSNTHEVMLSISACSRYGGSIISCPAYY